jgi:hypothetical protein
VHPLVFLAEQKLPDAASPGLARSHPYHGKSFGLAGRAFGPGGVRNRSPENQRQCRVRCDVPSATGSWRWRSSRMRW